MEKQIHIIVKKSNGNLDVVCARFHGSNINGTVMSHSEMSSLKPGQSFSWNKSDMYMTKVEGIIVAKKQQDWDYSKPLGQRALNVIVEGDYDLNLKLARA
jgi:hypothetical protein